MSKAMRTWATSHLVLTRVHMVSGFFLLLYGLKLLRRHTLEGINRKEKIPINWPFEERMKDEGFLSHGGQKTVRKMNNLLEFNMRDVTYELCFEADSDSVIG